MQKHFIMRTGIKEGRKEELLFERVCRGGDINVKTPNNVIFSKFSYELSFNIVANLTTFESVLGIFSFLYITLPSRVLINALI